MKNQNEAMLKSERKHVRKKRIVVQLQFFGRSHIVHISFVCSLFIILFLTLVHSYVLGSCLRSIHQQSHTIRILRICRKQNSISSLTQMTHTIPIKSALSRIYVRFFVWCACVCGGNSSSSSTDCLLTLNRTNPRHNINKLHSYTRTNIISLARFFSALLLSILGWQSVVLVVGGGGGVVAAAAAVAIYADIFVVVATHPFIDYFHVCNL